MKRFALGLIKGALLGAGIALILGKALGIVTFVGLLGYALASATGVVVGLFAGKPFWAKGALIEVILKSGVGAVVAAAVLYGLRRWLPTAVDLGPLGQGSLGELPAFALPLIAIMLGILFELDNTGVEPASDVKARVAEPKSRIVDDTALERGDADDDSRVIGRARGKS